MKDNLSNNKQSQIKQLLENFGSKFLDVELKSYVLNLFEKISKKSLLNIYRGKNEIWAASIIYVIARFNFLFDKENDNYISIDELCDYFNVKKSTIGNKATQIEKIYNISIGDKKYTKPVFEYYKTTDGFIIPSFLIDKKEIITEAAEGKEIEELKRFEEERKRAEEQRLKEKQARRTEINRKISEEKRKKRDAGQLNLFDDLDKREAT
jgi:frataxin-like iron-binding protein CyaY